MALLEARDLTMVFGGLKAVSRFNLTVDAGEVLGIIGPNGAGKTTVFNMLSGVYRPTSGDILLEGRSLIGLRPSEVNQAGLARTFQNLRLFSNLSVIDNVKVALHARVAYGVWNAMLWDEEFKMKEVQIHEKAELLLDVFKLSPKARETASSLPYGEQKRLEIARALATDPKVLLLDEPAAGMNPKETIELIDLLGWVRTEFKATIVLIEHRMDVVMNFCERIVAMDFGEIIAEGTPAEIQGHPRVIEAYLGRGDEIGNLRNRRLGRQLRVNQSA